MADIFVAVVLTVNAGSHTVAVARNSYGGLKAADAGAPLQGIVVSNTIATFLGFKETSLPQPGSNVLCLAQDASHCYILGVIPQTSDASTTSLPMRMTHGGGHALGDAANRVGHTDKMTKFVDARRPADVVEGEYCLSNELGVLLGLSQLFATLKGSELAQIQCHLLDDLVRLVSHNFQHYTALGEYNIWHDGKTLMAEFGATHKPAEALGQPTIDNDYPTNSSFERDGNEATVDDSKDFYKIRDDERLKAIERFKYFLGGLGDFFHLFLCRPAEDTKRYLAADKKPDKPDTGLFDVHIGTDGGFHVRSVKEIFLEKTNWIRVPLRYAAPEDPKGDDSVEYTKKDTFEFDDSVKVLENPIHYALQLRDYVAYVNEVANYKNFKAHEKDIYVNDELSKEQSLKEIKQVDAQTVLDQVRYALRSCGVYLMPNGGITIKDAWNSAIVMEGGNIYLQPAKDLVTQPLRNFINKVGGHFQVNARKEVDIASAEGGVRVKAETPLYLFSHASGVVIEANGKNNVPNNKESDTALEDIGGIVFKSKLGMYSYAEEDIVSYTKRGMKAESKEGMDFVSGQDFTAYSKNMMMLMSKNLTQLHSEGMTYVLADTVTGIAGGTNTLLGQKDQNLTYTYPKDYKGFTVTLSGVLPVSEFADGLAKIKEVKDSLLNLTIFSDEKTLDALQFRFLASSSYGSLDRDKDALPATLAQQDELTSELYSLEDWKDKKVNETYPFPGKEMFEKFFYYSSDKLVNLEKNSLGSDLSNKATAGTKPAKLTPTSLDTYKVQKV